MREKRKKDIRANEEKELLLNPERSAQKKRKRRLRVLAWCGGTVLSVAVMVCIGIMVLSAMGKASLKRVAAQPPELAAAEASEKPTAEEVEVWEEDWIKYRGKVYDYNEDILTFLFMGIDQRSETVQEVAEGTNGGQADALFLLVMNPRRKSMDIIGINRNTMTSIDMYDEQGAFVNTITAQIAIQHGFGNGMEKSCEYQKAAVSRLFYQLPIHGYVALNMSAVAELNDAVGGVDVTVLEDLTRSDPALIKGERVHLEGQSAFLYVRDRDTSVLGSSDSRLERQKQYLKSFADAAKAAVKEDPMIVSKLYQAATPKMVTDISMDEAVYLAGEAMNYRITENSFRMLAGKSTEGEQFEEFYIDETALFELILEIFYEPVLTSG